MSFRIHPDRPLGEEVRRIFSEEIGKSVAILEETDEQRLGGLHDTRKRLKKLRGLVRLIRPGDADFSRRENVRLRDVARTLSAARDATALVETVDRFRADFPDDFDQAMLARVRRKLVRRRTRVVRAGSGLLEPVSAAIASLREAEADASRLQLPEAPDSVAEILSRGVAANVKRARRALKKARRDGAVEDFHELRKATKHYWFDIGLLRQAWPRALAGHRAEANRLGDLLGELNDIAVIRALSRSSPSDIGPGDDIAHFLRLLKHKEAALQAESLSAARALYALKPATVALLVEERWRAAAAGPAQPDAAERNTEAA